LREAFLGLIQKAPLLSAGGHSGYMFNKLNFIFMKKLMLILGIAFLSGAVFTAFGQSRLDTVNNNYKKGINQNPVMNDNQDKNLNNSNQSPAYNYNQDITSPGQNSSDIKLNKEDSVTLYKKGGTLINTDSSSQYPVNGPSDRTYGTPTRKNP
jgi:hypothetical protein